MKTKIAIIIIFSILSSISLHSQWLLMSNGNGIDTAVIRSLGVIGNNICAGTNTRGISYTTNNGEFWIQSSLNNECILAMASNSTTIFAGTVYYYTGVYASTNNGSNWNQTSLNNQRIISLGVNGNNVFAGTSNANNVYHSTNNGLSWNLTLANHHITSFAFNGNNTFAGDNYAGGVFLSTDNGANWSMTSLIPGVISLASSGNNIIAGTQIYHLYLTTNNGANWSNIFINDNNEDYSLATIGNSVFAGTANGVFVSNNNGATWSQRNEGLSASLQIVAVCVSNGYIFAGNYGGGIYRRPLSEVIGIKNISEDMPAYYILSQNYPNPFNPSTKIKYQIPKTSFVKMTVYDILGKEVVVLVNEKQSPGTYEVEWDASNYPSGVYFYKLQTESFNQTKRMVLVK